MSSASWRRAGAWLTRIRTLIPAPVAALVIIGILHRGIAFARFRGALDSLIAQKPGYITMQLLPLGGYMSHFWRSLWLLQQSPPLDQVVMKIALMLAPFPYGVAHLLCLFNAALTIASACLLYLIARRVTGSRMLGFCLAAGFMLSTDTLVLEYALFGQMFYEFLAMLGAAIVCALLLGMARRTGRAAGRQAALAGVATAFTALSRSSFSYFAVPLAAFGLTRWRWRNVAAFLLPVLLLQGAWAAKNACVYGDFSLETSSWSGLNAQRGLLWSNQQKQFCNEIVSGRLGDYPEWFVRMNRDCPLPFSDVSESYVPDWARQRDAAIAAGLAGNAPPWNTIALQLKAAAYRTAILRFTAAHPALAWQRLAIGYHIFWQRIADFGALLFDPLFVVPADRPLPALFARGFGEKQRVMLSIAPPGQPPKSRSTAFWTISLAPLDAISLAALHVVFPLLLGIDAWRHLRRRRGFLPPGTALLATVTLYGLVMFCAFDVGENMRFRLAIEPEILALTGACMVAAARALKAAAGSSKLLRARRFPAKSRMPQQNARM